MLAVGSSGLNWMTLRRTFGLPLQPGAPSQRKSQHRYSAKSGEGCRPNISGGRSSYGGGCCLTECTSMHPRGNPKKNSMLCSLTRPPDATAQTLMTRKGIVGLESGRSKHGGRLAKIGWHSLKNKVYRLSMTSRRYWRRFQTRTQQHGRKLMHSWRIVQKGGRRERVRINSSVDVFQTLETRLGIKVLILIWLISAHGQRGELLLGGRESLRGWEGRVCFTCFTQFANFPGHSAWLGAWRVCGCCLVVGFVFRLFFFSGKFVFTINSSGWPTMSRTSPAMQEKKKEKNYSQSFPTRHHLGWSWIGFCHPFINFSNQFFPARHHVGWSWIELLSFVKSFHFIYFFSRSPPLRLVLVWIFFGTSFFFIFCISTTIEVGPGPKFLTKFIFNFKPSNLIYFLYLSRLPPLRLVLDLV